MMSLFISWVGALRTHNACSDSRLIHISQSETHINLISTQVCTLFIAIIISTRIYEQTLNQNWFLIVFELQFVWSNEFNVQISHSDSSMALITHFVFNLANVRDNANHLCDVYLFIARSVQSICATIHATIRQISNKYANSICCAIHIYSSIVGVCVLCFSFFLQRERISEQPNNRRKWIIKRQTDRFTIVSVGYVFDLTIVPWK